MPIYAYKCESCGHQLDALQKLSDDPLSVCPACGAPALVKQLTAAGFQLKGSGWYQTDFRNNGNPPATKEAAASPESDAAKDKPSTATPVAAGTPAAPASAAPAPAPAATTASAPPSAAP